MAQNIGFMVELQRPRLIAGAAEKLCDLALRAIDVGLHFDERDRRGGERTVGVDDRVAESFQPWLLNPFSVLDRYST